MEVANEVSGNSLWLACVSRNTYTVDVHQHKIVLGIVEGRDRHRRGDGRDGSGGGSGGGSDFVGFERTIYKL